MIGSRAVSGLLLVCGGALLAVAAWLIWPKSFPHAWLAAVFTALGLPLGSMMLLLAHALTGGRWMDALRLPLTVWTATLPLVLALCAPIGFLLPTLYPWARAGAAALPNTFYLNVPFFAGRAGAYAVIWLVVASTCIAGALRGDAWLRKVAAPCLILLAVTVTFASIDFAASLDPRNNSSVFGLLRGTGMAVLALSAAMLVAVPRSVRRGRDDLGKVLLALCLLYAYLDFVEFLIVWSSNLPHDASWFARRTQGAWFWVLQAMAVLHTAGAVLVLGVPRARRSDRLVTAFAAALVVSAIGRGWWLVLPEVPRAPGVGDVACMAGVLLAVMGFGLAVLRLPALNRRLRHA